MEREGILMTRIQRNLGMRSKVCVCGVDIGMVRSEGTGDDGGRKETVFSFLQLLSLAALLAAALAYSIRLFHIP